MKRLWVYILITAVFAPGIAGAAVTAYADENGKEAVSYDQVASEDEKAAAKEVGVEGMKPVYGADVVDGVYQVEVESSSSMFRIAEAELTVKEEEMTAVLTMGGTGYLKLFMGTGEEAAASDASAYIDYVENEEGQHTYRIPVEALDQPIACAAFSKNKEKWYDRSILFRADSLPEEAVLTELPDYEALEKAAKEKRIAAMKAEKAAAEAGEEVPEAEAVQTPVRPALIEMEDGEYAIGTELSGGSGKSTVTSPALLIVKDGLAYARIEWSSSSYDYMVVGGEKYFPVNEEGYSTFEIPILVFNEPMPVIADTTAMSTPHEVEYALTFYTDEIMSKNQTPQAAAQRVVYMVIAIVSVCIVVSFVTKRRRNYVK